PQRVLIHDGARPFPDQRLVDRVIEGLDKAVAAIPCLPLRDTIKRGEGETIQETIDRSALWRAQTPQGFHFDAILAAHRGAIGAGDIGMHFPPSDPRWRGAASDQFLTHAVDLVRARGGAVAAVDVTIICERPKIAPYRIAMVERIAAILGIKSDRVSVKATTTEKLGFTGRAEGMAAQAVAT